MATKTNLINNTLESPVITGPISANSSVGSAGDVLTSAGSGSPAVWAPASGGGFTWQTSAGATMVAGNGYIASGNATRTFSLPATATIGDTYSVMSWGGYGASNGWLINLIDSAHGTIDLGTSSTTGSLSSTAYGDTITLVCVYDGSGNPGNYAWQATSVIGNITVV